MPGLDGTGPQGQGAMTGGGRGFCARPVGPSRPGLGRGGGFGRGRGFRGGGGCGRGWRNGYFATGLPGWARFGDGGNAPAAAVTPETEKQWLAAQAKALQEQLNAVQERLAGLDTAAKQDT